MLFLNVYGEPLKYESLKTIFDRLAVKSGITRLHPHLLRHTAATKMRQRRGPPLSPAPAAALRHPDDASLPPTGTLAASGEDANVLPLTGIAEPRQRVMLGSVRRVK